MSHSTTQGCRSTLKHHKIFRPTQPEVFTTIKVVCRSRGLKASFASALFAWSTLAAHQGATANALALTG